MFKMRFRLSKYVFEGLRTDFIFLHTRPYFHSQNIKYNFLEFHRSHDPAECKYMYYPMGRNILFLKCLLCCNVDFSELSLHLNSTDVNLVLFYTTQKISNLSLFSELCSQLMSIYNQALFSY